jgi:uncharacterized protein (DUF983 family)
MFSQTRLYSIFFNKCPRCHKGQFFKSNHSYQLKQFDKMNDECSQCGENFNRETGFYFGAMYVSYGLAVIIGLVMFLIMVLLLKTEVFTFLITYSIIILLLSPWIFRKSRLTWINLFVGYKK